MSMRYEVKITPFAVDQISKTVEYISKELLVPETAKAWSDHLEKEIKSLDTMPARFPLTDREPWRSKGIRKMQVKNFIVYYFTDDDKKTVWVISVVYSRRDQLNALKNMPVL